MGSAPDGHLHLTALPRVSAPGLAEFERLYAKTGTPVCIRGALDDWPALGRWSPADFSTRFGERQIEAFALDGGEIVLDPQRGFDVRRLTVADYVDACQREGAPSLYFRARLPNALPELEDELRIPAYCRPESSPTMNLWFSGAGTLTRLHFDNPHNLVSMVYGRKRFILYPFSDRRALYAHSLTSSSPQFAAVDPEEPDYERFPRFARARGFEVTLEAGDALYIPPRMYHYARSIETSISVNFWWNDRVTASLVAIAAWAKKLRGIDV